LVTTTVDRRSRATPGGLVLAIARLPARGHPGVGARPKVGQQACGAARCHRKWMLDSTDRLLHIQVCAVESPIDTLREANDRDYECVVLEDCVGSYFPEFQRAALAIIKAQGGIFGWASDSKRALAALKPARPAPRARAIRRR
jgi:hypothetical protein